MKICPECKIEIGGTEYYCPLCGSELTLSDDKGGEESLYPDFSLPVNPPNRFPFLAKLFAFLSLIAVLVCGLIDLLIKKTFPDVECASTGVDDHMQTYITRAELTDDVRRWLAATTHLSESAFEVKYIQELPKNEAGKILYKELH